jgi:hypothetical protein
MIVLGIVFQNIGKIEMIKIGNVLVVSGNVIVKDVKSN